MDYVEAQEKINKNIKLSGLHYSGNSCFMDSVLMAMFLTPNKFVNRNILYKILKKSFPQFGIDVRKKVQNAIRNIVMSIRGYGEIKNCGELRKYLSECKSNISFHDGSQQEAGEFLIFLLSIFDVKNAVKETVTYVTNSDETANIPVVTAGKNVDKTASIVHFVDSFTLRKKVNMKPKLSEFLKVVDDSGRLSEDNAYKMEDGRTFLRKISVDSVVDTKYLVFWLQRVDVITGQVLPNVVDAENVIILQSGRRLRLRSVVLHSGSSDRGHYICCFKYKRKWFIYDDMNPYNINEMKDLSPLTCGTLYFYSC